MTKENVFRYQSQVILPEIGDEGQANLSKARVLIVGAGGLGGPVGLYLAGAGIGSLGIVDGDLVEITNLHRQVLFGVEDVGKNKAMVAKEHMLSINPTIRIEAYPFYLETTNALALMGAFDIIVDATDNFLAKYLINETAVQLGLPVVFSAVTGFEGQISVFWAQKGPCYSCIYPERPVKPIANCADSGVLGPLAGVFGSLQACEVIKLLLKPIEGHLALTTLIGKLLVLEVGSWQIAHLDLAKRQDCKVCAKEPKNRSMTSDEAIVNSKTPMSFYEISADDLKKMGAVKRIDVREKAQWESGHLEGAQNIPFSSLILAEDALSHLDKSEPYVLYCQHGILSKKAAEFLVRKGFSHVSHLKGGISCWRGALSSVFKC